MRPLLFIAILFLVACSESDSSETHGSNGSKDEHQNVLILGDADPTIVFESGLGDQLENWEFIQRELSQYARTFSYDRYGLGHSPSTTKPRTLENQVSELKSILEYKEINGPIILVGHSLGGYIIRKFQAEYPDQVVGMVLIDGSMEYLDEMMMEIRTEQERDSLKKVEKEWYAQFAEPIKNEFVEFEKSSEKIKATTLPTDIPITAIISFKESEFLTANDVDIKRKLVKDWKKQAPQMRIDSTFDSGHYIHMEDPHRVINEIKKILKSIQEEM